MLDTFLREEVVNMGEKNKMSTALASLAAALIGINIGIYLTNVTDYFTDTDIFTFAGFGLIILSVFINKKKT